MNMPLNMAIANAHSLSQPISLALDSFTSIIMMTQPAMVAIGKRVGKCQGAFGRKEVAGSQVSKRAQHGARGNDGNHLGIAL